MIFVLNDLYAITLELNHEGPLDHVDGHNQSVLTPETYQDPFHAAQDSIRNTNSLPDL